MMVGPIVTSALLMDLAEVAEREGMTPLDPWEGGPIHVPAACHKARVLRLDGSIETILDLAYRDPDWSTVAAARFEGPAGDLLAIVHVDEYVEGDFEDEGSDDVVLPASTPAPDQPRLTPGA